MTERFFEGSAFHPDLVGGRSPGSLRFESERLVFEPAGEGVAGIALPLNGLELRLGGAGDRLIFFAHPESPEISIYTADHGVLDDPSLASLGEQIGRVRGQKQRGRAVSAAILLALVLAVGGLFAAKDPLVGVAAAAVPASIEVELGDLFFRQIRGSTRLIEDAELMSQLEALVAPLLATLPDTGYPFQFHLAEDSTLNAFALPGGNVVLHSGLILEAGSAEEVLGVLAHEIAHVTRRHSLRQIISSAGLYVIVQSLLGDVSGLIAVVADGGLQLLTLRFSRDFENDADATGFEYLIAAGIDPRGMITFFDRLLVEQEAAGGAGELQENLAFLSTHPATRDRIEHLEELLVARAPGTVAPPTFDFVAFQDALRNRIHPE